MADITSAQRNRSTTPRIDRAIARIAGRQHGLVTAAQLRRLGLSPASITRRTRAGRLHRVHRTVYSVGHAALSCEARWLAAVLAVGEGAALSHLAAAQHWNIWRRSIAAIDVVCRRQVRPLPGVRVHRARSLTARDVRWRNGIRVTSVARTFLDLGDMLTPHQLAKAMHEAEFRGLLDIVALERLLARSRGRRAVTVVRAALAIRATGSSGTDSELEDRWLAGAHARGLDPLVNVQVPTLDGAGVRPDFLFPDADLVVEMDGSGHRRERTRREDLGRDARLREAGYTVLRCRPEEIEQNLDLVEAYLAERREPLPRRGGGDPWQSTRRATGDRGRSSSRGTRKPTSSSRRSRRHC